MNYKSYDDLCSDIKNNLSQLYEYDFDLVVGIPRSGMIPAYMIALYLNINCTDLMSFIENKKIKSGETRSTRKNLSYPQEALNILLVDDSIYSGNSMKKNFEIIPDFLKNRVKKLAIYSLTPGNNDVDIFFEHVSKPRIFEWNIFHKDYILTSCIDIDGVLCRDPNDIENDDGERYINFLKNVKPKFTPTGKIHSLVSNRLEKYRTDTELWLAKYNIDYENLILQNVQSKQERLELGQHALFKAKYYKDTETNLFIESDRIQAEKICEFTNKPVYCVENNHLYTSDSGPFLKPMFKKMKKNSFIRKIYRLIFN